MVRESEGGEEVGREGPRGGEVGKKSGERWR